MNYYSHHLGDYDGATAHLSWDEDMAYTRLLRAYYRREKPIPVDPGETYRLVRATTAAQKKAVSTVLQEFFQEGSDGWHNKRADEEIAKAQADGEVNKDRRENEKLRQQRHRDRRQNLFAGLREHGITPPWDATTDELQAALSRVTSPSNNAPVTRDNTVTNTACVSSDTTATPIANSQEPIAKSQKPKAKTQESQNQESQKPAAAAKTPRSDTKTGPTESAYCEAYAGRYTVRPVMNGKQRGLMARFIDRVGGEEAPAIAAFYVRSNRGLYVSSKHCLDLLLRDAEGIRTEWATGKSVTDTEARQADRTQATGNAFAPLIAEAEERERITHASE